jgi:hypothetical protein
MELLGDREDTKRPDLELTSYHQRLCGVDGGGVCIISPLFKQPEPEPLNC